MRRWLTLAFVAVSLFVTGCPSPAPATEVVVVFDADRVVQRVAQDIEIVGYGGSRDDGLPRENVQTLRFNIADIGGWPITHTLVPLGGDASRLFQVEGRLFDQEGVPIAHVRATSGYLDERALELRMRFYAHCLYVDPCQAEAESCNANGDCVLAVSAPEGLPDVPDGGVGTVPDGGEAACRTELDCDDLVECTVDTCLDGACVNREDHTLCDGDGTCDGAAGCQYGTTCDATTCQPEGCDQIAECVEGVCLRTSKCSPAQECCGSECVTCNDGSICTHGACDPAASACVSSSRDATCTDGIYCNGLEHCIDGSCQPQPPPCGASLMCDEESAACVGCLGDGDCAAPVDLPASGACVPVTEDVCSSAGEQTFYQVTTSCDGGSCVETMTPMGASCVVPGIEGSSCGTGDVEWGLCEPDDVDDPCTTDGTITGRTSVDVCRRGACVSEGAGGIRSEWCSITPPPECFVIDSGVPEAGMDSGTGDTGTTDSGVPDSEAGTDSGLGDSGPTDSGVPDSEAGTDSGAEDSGAMDSGSPDSSDFDSGAPPADTGPWMDSSSGADTSVVTDVGA